MSWSIGEKSLLRFYQKVVKVKAQVAALHIFFSDTDDAAKIPIVFVSKILLVALGQAGWDYSAPEKGAMSTIVASGPVASNGKKKSHLAAKLIASAAILTVTGLFVLKYALRYYLNYNAAAFADQGAPNYWSFRGWLMMHITGGMTADPDSCASSINGREPRLPVRFRTFDFANRTLRLLFGRG